MTHPDVFPPLRVRRATRRIDRMRGLLGRRALDADEALVIEPCTAIHTIGMQFPIDVVFMGKDGRILSVHAAVPPWRLRVSLRARCVLELSAGGAARRGWVVGGVLTVSELRP